MKRLLAFLALAWLLSPLVALAAPSVKVSAEVLKQWNQNIQIEWEAGAPTDLEMAIECDDPDLTLFEKEGQEYLRCGDSFRYEWQAGNVFNVTPSAVSRKVRVTFRATTLDGGRRGNSASDTVTVLPEAPIKANPSTFSLEDPVDKNTRPLSKVKGGGQIDRAVITSFSLKKVRKSDAVDLKWKVRNGDKDPYLYLHAECADSALTFRIRPSGSSRSLETIPCGRVDGYHHTQKGDRLDPSPISRPVKVEFVLKRALDAAHGYGYEVVGRLPHTFPATTR